jgi:outer membrane receptor protein involved in Fe transport
VQPAISYSAGDTIVYPNGYELVLADSTDFYNSEDIYNATLAASGLRDGYEADPWQGAFYFQDKMEWEGMIVNAGLRVDVWYLGGDYDIDTGNFQGSYLESINPDSTINENYYITNWGTGEDQINPLDDPENYQKYLEAKKYHRTIKDRFETPEIMISPRLGISHPISEKAVLHFAYNYQRQLPQMQYIYTTGRPQDVIENPSADIIIGNPELEAQSTITYEAGLQYQLGEDYVLDITTYYKNIYNYVSTQEVTDSLDTTLKWNEYISEDYGSARGVDINLQKLLSNFISGSASYSLTWANGNHSETTTTNAESLREFPLNWDIRNSFNLNMTFQIAKGEEFYIPFTDVILPLDDFTTNFSYNISSGIPYTVSDDEGNLSEETNSDLQPYTERADLTIRKNFSFAGRKRLSFYATINNLFNKMNVNNVYSITGSPYYSGVDLDTNNDNYVAPETIDMRNMIDKDPANVTSGRTYKFGISFRW